MLVRQPIDVMIFVLSTLHAGKKLGKAVNRTLICMFRVSHPSKPHVVSLLVGLVAITPALLLTMGKYVCWYVVDLDMYLYV